MDKDNNDLNDVLKRLSDYDFLKDKESYRKRIETEMENIFEKEVMNRLFKDTKLPQDVRDTFQQMFEIGFIIGTNHALENTLKIASDVEDVVSEYMENKK